MLESIIKQYKISSDKGGYILGLRTFHKKLTNILPNLKDKEEFGIALIYKLISGDILANSIEDDYINNSNFIDMMGAFNRTLENALTGNYKKWFSSFFDFFTELKEVGTNGRLSPTQEEVNGATYYMRRAGHKYITGNGIGVYPIFPILELALSNPDLSNKICNQFVDKIEDIRHKRKITKLCFLEKDYATVGALVLMPYLVNKLKLPAMIYREGYWVEDAKFIGQIPTLTPDLEDRICIVYDALITGKALLDAKKYIESKYKNAKVNSAVVYFFFKEKNTIDRFKKAGILFECIKTYSPKEMSQVLRKNYLKELHKLELDAISHKISESDYDKDLVEIYKKYYAVKDMLKTSK